MSYCKRVRRPRNQAQKLCRVCGCKLVGQGGRWVDKTVCDYCASGGKNVRVVWDDNVSEWIVVNV